jgi:hypothetical protein
MSTRRTIDAHCKDFTAARSSTAMRSGATGALVDWQTPFSEVSTIRSRRSRVVCRCRTNLCYNAVDRHLAARGEQKALIYLSTETGLEKTYTYRELAAEVNRFAAIYKPAWAAATAC